MRSSILITKMVYEYDSLENNSITMKSRLKLGDIVGKKLSDKRGFYQGRVICLSDQGVEIENTKGKKIIPISEIEQYITHQNVDIY